ncbi:MAG: hypothetical protein Q4C77_04360 [Eubacteriales bacterium]|nr:hypothetical protein [Eubacteriales bacterium]
MKHFEELRIGVTAVLFCMVMLFVYAFFPQDGFVPATKAPMPEIPSSDSWSGEEDYGFQIYTEESNYDDSYSDSDNSAEEDSSYDTSQQEPDTAETDSGNGSYQESNPDADTDNPPDAGTVPDNGDASDNGTADESPSTEDTSGGDSYAEEPSVDESYDIESGEEAYEDEINWNETEQTFNYE